jgi:dTDP-4-dehydrorhamnose reductase
MNGNKVLVIGGSGFIGQNIMHYFSCNGTSRTGRQGLIKLDIRDGTQVKKVLESYEPAVVINSAGITNVDYCEAHTDEAKHYQRILR